MAKPGILYVSYDGMLEPLGQSQVLAYLERLAGDYAVHLISFEKKADWKDEARRAALTDRIQSAGIRWIPLRYHKSPTAPATLFDIAMGTAVALWVCITRRIRVVHARSYIPGLIALFAKRATGAAFLFDMRGLWADERVDAGLWPAGGRLYRAVKALEKTLLLAADRVVTLTRASAAEIGSFPYMAQAKARTDVIPTCADLDLFSRRPDVEEEGFVYGFVGAAGTWSLLDQVLISFRLLLKRRPDARLLIVNRNEHDLIRKQIAASGVDPSRIELVAAEHRDMPALISRMTAAAALRKPSYSQIACAPTKLAEYLGCGVPCLVNLGIGDTPAIVEEDRVGVAISGFDPQEMQCGVDRLIALADEPDIRRRCVAAARARFSLEDGVAVYRTIYRRLTNEATAR